MVTMRARLLFASALSVLCTSILVAPQPSFAGVAFGSSCSPAGSKAIASGKLFTCTKVGTKTKWNSGTICPALTRELVVNAKRYICVRSGQSRSWAVQTVPARPSATITVSDNEIFLSPTTTPSSTAPVSRVQYSQDGGITWSNYSTSSTPVRLSGLTPNTDYSLRVRAMNSVGSSAVLISNIRTRNSLTHATLRFDSPNISSSSAYRSLSNEREWSVNHDWYSPGLRSFHVQALVGSTIPIVVVATDQDGFPIVGKTVQLKVNKRYSNSTASFKDASNNAIGLGSDSADGAILTSTTDLSGKASFTIANTNVESQVGGFPPNATDPRGPGVLYGQIAPSMFAQESAQTIDIVELGFYKTIQLGMANAPTPTVAGHVVGQLLWSDDFNQGNTPSATNWTRRQCGFDPTNGGGTCYNNEQQYFAQSAITQDGTAAGLLTIKATHLASASDRPADSGTCLSWSGTCPFVSGRMDTQGNLYIKYGYLEARIMTPIGGANWPAFWMLGKNITQPETPWPISGEIDIMEGKGASPNLTTGAIHLMNREGTGDQYSAGSLTDSTGFPGVWHTYSLTWLGSDSHDHDYIQLSVDGRAMLTVDRNTAGLPNWPFNQPFFIILNNAVGDFGGAYDGWTESKMYVDYIRYYQLDGQGAVSR